MFTKPLSYSSLKTFYDCPYKFKAQYIDGNWAPRKQATDRGTELHNLLEQFFKGSPYPSSVKELKPWQRFMEALSVKPNEAEGEAAVDGAWNRVPYKSKEAVYRGKWDLKVDEQEGILDIFDWKSGKIYDDHADQGLTYCAMNPGYTTYRTHFVYLDQPTVVISNTYDADFIESERKELSEKIELIRSTTIFLPNPGRPRCNWCHLSWRKGGECRKAP